MLARASRWSTRVGMSITSFKTPIHELLPSRLGLSGPLPLGYPFAADARWGNRNSSEFACGAALAWPVSLTRVVEPMRETTSEATRDMATILEEAQRKRPLEPRRLPKKARDD